jgi:hypothetical protein
VLKSWRRDWPAYWAQTNEEHTRRELVSSDCPSVVVQFSQFLNYGYAMTRASLCAGVVLLANQCVAEPMNLQPIRYLVRSLAPASHAGARPRPLQVAPLLGSR